MLVEMKDVGGLKFVGHYVLMPADEIWCVVLEPQNVVIYASLNDDDAEGFARHLEASLHDMDRLKAINFVRVYRATELLRADRKENRDIDQYTKNLRKWCTDHAKADAELFGKSSKRKPRLAKVS